MSARSPLSRFVRVAPGEGPGLAWASASFFFLLGGYYIIRPLREEMGASSGGGFALNWLFLGTLAGTFLVTPLFGTLVSRVPRRVFVPAVYHALAGSFVLFYVALSVLSGPQRLATARFFFVFVSTFNLLIVSVFWGFLADLFPGSSQVRLLGLAEADDTVLWQHAKANAFATSPSNLCNRASALLLSARKPFDFLAAACAASCLRRSSFERPFANASHNRVAVALVWVRPNPKP